MDKLIIAPGTDPDQYYASGLALHGTFITLVRGKKKIIGAAGFEYPQAAAKYDAVRLEDLGKDWKAITKTFLKKYCVKQPLMANATRASIYKIIPGAKLTHTLFPERAIKRADEIAKIKLVQRASEAAILSVKEVLQKSEIVEGKAKYQGGWLTSEQLKRVAAIELAKYNCSCPDMIISSGKQTALPHHEGTGVIREGPVVIDVFPKSHESFYYSDCTRTYVLGNAPKTFDERYGAILEVHEQVRKQLKHSAKNIEKIPQEVFSERGFKTDAKKQQGYIHSLGHGVGLEIHEEPRLSGKLITGNVITIEPGLYYDYGIRVEDIGVVTKVGFTNFVKLDKNPYLSK